ncbi:hypothetical protein CEUSTIGMA_g4010.t1 [Chlamydomonas eustigma]|uniref:SET domain-containing protein n=1 Tax=Chlamydomonas eustigma TaxID=1157962 RepID=A0A250X0E0_9CHLO|nr:hypothetical protein CEUSTIGMA_g4010.t1 [Chlamydomonas eustigma]|eukprot:GAX76564.1 hypothetical protein CEUSTIGMA_g4010.t1 [Chlamydomonas eustigma]
MHKVRAGVSAFCTALIFDGAVEAFSTSESMLPVSGSRDHFRLRQLCAILYQSRAGYDPAVADDASNSTVLTPQHQIQPGEDIHAWPSDMQMKSLVDAHLQSQLDNLLLIMDSCRSAHPTTSKPTSGHGSFSGCVSASLGFDVQIRDSGLPEGGSGVFVSPALQSCTALKSDKAESLTKLRTGVEYAPSISKLRTGVEYAPSISKLRTGVEYDPSISKLRTGVEYDPSISKSSMNSSAGPDTISSAGPDTISSAGPDTISSAGPDTISSAGPDTISSAGPDTISSPIMAATHNADNGQSLPELQLFLSLQQAGVDPKQCVKGSIPAGSVACLFHGPSTSQWGMLKKAAWYSLWGDDYYKSNHYLLDRSVNGSCIDGRPATQISTSLNNSCASSDMLFSGSIVNHPNQQTAVLNQHPANQQAEGLNQPTVHVTVTSPDDGTGPESGPTVINIMKYKGPEERLMREVYNPEAGGAPNVMFYNAMLWSKTDLGSSVHSSSTQFVSESDRSADHVDDPLHKNNKSDSSMSYKSDCSDWYSPRNSSSRERKCVTMLVALRDISPGEELFVDYGYCTEPGEELPEWYCPITYPQGSFCTQALSSAPEPASD